MDEEYPSIKEQNVLTKEKQRARLGQIPIFEAEHGNQSNKAKFGSHALLLMELFKYRSADRLGRDKKNERPTQKALLANLSELW